MVVLLLVVIWVIVLAGLALNSRTQSRVSGSVERFQNTTQQLQQTNPYKAYASSSPIVSGESVGIERENIPLVSTRSSRERLRRQRQRRLRTLASLTGFVVGTFLFGIVPAARFLWVMSLVGLVATFVYVALLVRMARLVDRRAERARKVVPIHLNGASRELSQRRRLAVGEHGGPVDFGPVPMVPKRPSFVIVEAPS